MPPQIAAVLCLGFIAILFWTEPKEDLTTTHALWIPFAWMFFAGSRYLSSWLNFSALESFSYDEGSPIDSALFGVLIAAGLAVLVTRRIDWVPFLWSNKLLVLYFAFCLLSAGWSDAPLISLKRWVKDLGNPIMVLVILTEPAPLLALAAVMRRLSYLLIPLSVLFVRYYPELGRVYLTDGTPMYVGVTQQKNALGQICMIVGIYFMWQIIQDRDRYLQWARLQRLCLIALAVMSAWLLYVSDSQTSLVCLFTAFAVLLCARLPFVRQRPTRLTDLTLLAGLTFVTLEFTFDVKDLIFDLLGRDPSLTNRTDIWALLFTFSRDPVLGAGFMSFWTGERMQDIWVVLGAQLLQAHNGYLEQFLNLGYVGLTLTIMLLVNAFFRLRGQLSDDPWAATLRLAFLYATALSNYTEASFYGVSNMWIILLFALIEPPKRQTRGAEATTLSGA